MSKRMYEDLKDTLKQEIRALSKKEMTKESLDTIYKLAESLKAVQTIEAMEQAEEGSSQEQGYSQYMPMGSYSMNMNSNRGSYDGSYRGGSYDGSYNRGSYNGGSYNNSSNRSGNNGDGGSYEGGSYNEGSYDGRRGRDGDSDGRYSENSNGSYRGYSRHTSKEKMMEKLEMMMSEASTEKEREAIKRCMEQIDS